MSLLRWNPKRDANELAIIETLQAAGAMVVRLSGKGVPDLLVGYQRHWCLIEVKVSRGTVTQAQAQTLAEARRRRLPVAIVRTPEGALEVLKRFRHV